MPVSGSDRAFLSSEFLANESPAPNAADRWQRSDDLCSSQISLDRRLFGEAEHRNGRSQAELGNEISSQ
jgi:hypothetical protein